MKRLPALLLAIAALGLYALPSPSHAQTPETTPPAAPEVSPAEPAEEVTATDVAPAAEDPVSADTEPAPTAPTHQESNMVTLKTTLGDITIKLFPDKAPVTVANFLAYVDSGHYTGTIFHRVINGFMIQGGGFDRNMRQKPTLAPIKNEAANGLQNKRGTIAMARTSVIDSATSQFFINVVDNAFLDYRSPDPRGFGYCVFGEVVSGMDVVDQIKAVRTGVKAGMTDVPLQTIEILAAERTAE